jgi:hypothetical protein
MSTSPLIFAAFDAVADLVLIVDDRNVVHANTLAMSILKLSASRLPSLSTLVPDFDPDCTFQPFLKLNLEDKTQLRMDISVAPLPLALAKSLGKTYSVLTLRKSSTLEFASRYHLEFQGTFTFTKT